MKNTILVLLLLLLGVAAPLNISAQEDEYVKKGKKQFTLQGSVLTIEDFTMTMVTTHYGWMTSDHLLLSIGYLYSASKQDSEDFKYSDTTTAPTFKMEFKAYKKENPKAITFFEAHIGQITSTSKWEGEESESDSASLIGFGMGFEFMLSPGTYLRIGYQTDQYKFKADGESESMNLSQIPFGISIYF